MWGTVKAVVRKVGLTALAGFLVAALLPATAAAATGYEHASTYSNPTLFTNQTRPQQMAVDPANGNLFIADHGLQTVHVFEPSGDTIQYLTSFGSSATIARPIGIAVDPNNGDIYVGAAGNPLATALVRFEQDPGLDVDNPARYAHDAGFGLSSTTNLGGLGSTTPMTLAAPQPGGIALDPGPNPDTGRADILVLDVTNNRVHRFDAEGDPVPVFPFPILGPFSYFNGPTAAPFQGVRAIAADADGNFTVADTPAGTLRIRTFGPDGTPVTDHSPVPSTTANGVAITAKPATGETFASSSPLSADTAVFQYEDGSQVATLPVPGVTGRIQGAVAAGENPGGRLYVSTGSVASWPLFGGALQIHAYDDLGQIPDPPSATIAELDPGEVGATTATFRGTVNPNDGQTRWRFEYRRTDLGGGEPWTELPLNSDPLTGTESVPVEHEAAGLEPATPYQVRLFATNGFGQTDLTEPPYPAFETGAVAPVGTTGAAWSVSAGRATLSGTVDPRNAATTYVFQYGTSDQYGQVTEPLFAGDGGTARQVTAEIQGLRPDTEYHFRIVATNAEHPELELSDTGDDAVFATRPASESALPERGYELVSQVDTNGIRAWPMTAADSGDAYTYATILPSPGAENAFTTHRRMTRNPDGSWSPDPFTSGPPVDPTPGAKLGAGGISPLPSGDHRRNFLQTLGSYHPLDQNLGLDIYMRDSATGEMTWITREPHLAPGQPSTNGDGTPIPKYVSDAGDHLVFTSSRPLLPTHQTTGAAGTLYEWVDGELRQVSLQPKPSPADPDQGFVGNSSAFLGGELHVNQNAVSSDGTRVVFEIRPPVGGTGLYIREDGQTTTQIGPAGSVYFGADRQTSQVFYRSGGGLFLHRVADHQAETVVAAGSGVGELFGLSDSGDRIYFYATSVLADGAAPGQRNLYLAQRDGGGFQFRFIATLMSDETGLVRQRPTAWQNVQVAGDGGLLAFTTRAELVPGRETGGLPQVYAYEADRDEVYCLSCPPGGVIPTGRGDIGTKGPLTPVPTGENLLTFIASEDLPAWRNVSLSGGTVVFQTFNSLVDGDSNALIDTYEWRGGELRLISSGRGTGHDLFADATGDAGTIFFTSRESFVPHGGVDGITRLYAARAGGGYRPPDPVPSCSGDECRGPATTPGVVLPASAAVRSRSAPARGARPARHCSRLGKRARLIQRRARALRVIVRRSSGIRRVKAKRRTKMMVRKAKVQRRKVQRCRRAAR